MWVNIKWVGSIFSHFKVNHENSFSCIANDNANPLIFFFFPKDLSLIWNIKIIVSKFWMWKGHKYAELHFSPGIVRFILR